LKREGVGVTSDVPAFVGCAGVFATVAGVCSPFVFGGDTERIRLGVSGSAFSLL